jgi:hypothetical protein
MNYTNKYYVPKKYAYSRTPGDGLPGRLPSPHDWKSGPDPIEHDKYYGWKKHQAQARFRNEEYELTWEDWQQLWPTELWLQRGRLKDNYTMYRRTNDLPWSSDNVVICRQRDKGQYYQPDRNWERKR